MLINIIAYFLQVLTYVVVQLDDVVIYQGGNTTRVTLLSVFMIFMVCSVCFWIAGGLLRHNGNSG